MKSDVNLLMFGNLVVIVLTLEREPYLQKPGLTYEREARLRKGSVDASDLRINELYGGGFTGIGMSD